MLAGWPGTLVDSETRMRFSLPHSPHPSLLEMGIPSFIPGSCDAGHGALFGQCRNWCVLGTNWLSRAATTRSGNVAPGGHWSFFPVAHLSPLAKAVQQGDKGDVSRACLAKYVRKESSSRSTGEMGPVWGRPKEASKCSRRGVMGCPGELKCIDTALQRQEFTSCVRV